MNTLPQRFGIPVHSEHSVVEHPVGENQACIKRTTVVWVDVGEPQLQSNKFTEWCFRAGFNEFEPVRSFDVPHDGVGDWDPSAVPPPDGELTSAETGPVKSGPAPAPAPVPAPAPMDPEPMEVEPDLEPEESHQEAVPVEPEVEHELTEEFEDPKGKYEEPKEEFEEEPEEEELEEEPPIEVPSESGSEDNPIEIKADPEWTPSRSHRG
ncbi:uncharacterized protein LOC130140539 [Syzygium oleosum]|uniref:uncharacterized protein LOC130140539 n=1 Tax=Syzygium oleosum TaxID=219896 RepID=UPI0024BAD4F2|nr:uncharacterized protein LOC130140539 [Syzygium oleosum]